MQSRFVLAGVVLAVLQAAAVAEEAMAIELAAAEPVRSLRGRYAMPTQACGAHMSRALLAQSEAAQRTEAEAEPSASGARTPPSHFTARVQFNGTFPGPGSATYRSMTAYWIYGEEHQERFTSLVLMRYLSSGPAIASQVYDSITTDTETMETSIDVWKGTTGDCQKQKPVKRLVEASGNYSINRFCPSMFYAAEAFPANMMTKGNDETIAVTVGAGSAAENIECETYGWTGEWDAMHKAWLSKKSGLLVKEVQRQAGGPVGPYSASAELTIAYDAVLPKSIFGMAPVRTELFAPPAACGKEL